MSTHDLIPAIRRFTAERHFRSATVERWLALSADDARALLDLGESLRLGENQLRDLWDWAVEIAGRERVTLAAVLAAPALQAALHRKEGRNDRLRHLKAELRRMRFPQLIASEERMEALVGRMNLPRNVRITLPPFLEGDSLRLEVELCSTDDLRRAARFLLQAADSAACAELFALLEEAP